MYFIMNKSRLLVIICLLVSSAAIAQVNDAGLWTSVNLEKKLSRKVSLHFTEELRFNENISELGMFFSELTGEYRFSKVLSVSGGYRFINKRSLDDSYSKRHRYLFNLNVKEKVGDLGLNLRIRYQSQYADVESSPDGMVPSNYVRPKLTLKYDLNKKYTPWAYGELFVNVNRADGMLLDNYRVGAGFEYEFSKRSSLELGYLVNGEVQVADPWTSYIISIGWNYIF
jgi:hypothetical protein